jgi:Spy/CpxP family protein refolding chaperone
MKFRMLLPIAFAAALAAQVTTTPGSNPGTNANRFSQIQTYLGLSSAQLTSLEQIRQSEAQALQTLRQTLSTKEQALRTLLNGTSPDPAAVGQAVLDVQSTRQQIQQQRQQFRTQAVAVLNADQQSKLQNLTQAQQLMPDIGEAAALDLIDGGSSNTNGAPVAGMFGGRGSSGGRGPRSGGQWRQSGAQ